MIICQTGSGRAQGDLEKQSFYTGAINLETQNLPNAVRSLP